jgi:cobalt-zinc-cadmium efflux system protein
MDSLRNMMYEHDGHEVQGGHAHQHHAHAASRELPLALGLTLAFAVIEAVVGSWSGSLALFGDAGHMFTDALALALAALAAWLAHRHVAGLTRIEPLAALVNILIMLVTVAVLLWHAGQRLANPQPVAGEAVTIVALVGLAINLFVAWRLSLGESDLNTRAALLHVVGDALGSVAALASGLIIQFTGWVRIDPLLTLLICALILASTLNLLRQVIHTLRFPPGH